VAADVKFLVVGADDGLSALILTGGGRENGLSQFFQRDILIQSKLSYGEALEEVVNILVDGIITRQ